MSSISEAGVAILNLLKDNRELLIDTLGLQLVDRCEENNVRSFSIEGKVGDWPIKISQYAKDCFNLKIREHTFLKGEDVLIDILRQFIKPNKVTDKMLKGYKNVLIVAYPKK
jgi:hypothetical protein